VAVIQRLRQKVTDRDYYLSAHAEEEMWADDLERADVENAILKGRIEKKLTKDPRGARYRIVGPSRDGTLIHVVCRRDSENKLRIVTVYALT
jgi:hypothetical protein